MTSPSAAAAFIADLLGLYDRLGHLHYGEDVSQSEHAVQTAHHAQADGAPAILVAASLLHDVGHLLQKAGEDAADRGLDTRHEHIGAGFLARAFGPEVTNPVRLHVAAKRFLALREPAYAQGLSPASIQSLALQGGPMTESEADAFLAEPGALEALRLRRYDEMGKVVGAIPADVASYGPLLLDLVVKAGRLGAG
jgi:phosphonate degradation associated HDIG domain protein